MIDDVEAFVQVANLLRERGAYKIYVMATHGVLSAEAPRLIEDSFIHEVRVSHSISNTTQSSIDKTHILKIYSITNKHKEQTVMYFHS